MRSSGGAHTSGTADGDDEQSSVTTGQDDSAGDDETETSAESTEPELAEGSAPSGSDTAAEAESPALESVSTSDAWPTEEADADAPRAGNARAAAVLSAPVGRSSTEPSAETVVVQRLSVAAAVGSAGPASAAEGTIEATPSTDAAGQPSALAAQPIAEVAHATAAAQSAAEAAPVSAAGVVSGVVSGLLAWVGLGPSATNTPAAPAGPGLASLVALAVVRRELQQAVEAQAPTVAAAVQTTEQTEPGLLGGVLHLLFNNTPVINYDPADNIQDADGVVVGNLNVTDADGDELIYSVDQAPQNGTVVVDAEGNFTYTPDADFAATGGMDTFAVTVSDDTYFHLLHLGGGHTASAAIEVTVEAVNQPPVVEDPPTVDPPDADSGEVTGTLNVVDPDGDELVYTVTVAPENGTVVINPDGTFVYTPTDAARLQAGLTAGADTDTFTVSVSEAGTAAPAAASVETASLATVGVQTAAVQAEAVQTTAAVETTATIPIAEAHLELVDTINVGDIATGVVVAPDGSRAYVSDIASGTVLVIETATNAVVDTIDVPGGPQTVTVSPDGARLYVPGSLDDTVSVIDTTSNTVIATISVGDFPADVAVSPDGGRLYVTNIGDPSDPTDPTGDAVTVIDTATNSVIASVPLPSPVQVAAHPDGTRVYVTSGTTLAEIDTATNTVVATTPALGGVLVDVAVSPDGTLIYATHGEQGLVSVIDPTSFGVLATIDVGTPPGRMAFSADSSLAYVGHINDGTVSVIDTATNTVISTFPASGFGAFDVAVSPDGTRIYTVHGQEGTVSVIAVTPGPAPAGQAPAAQTLTMAAATAAQPILTSLVDVDEGELPPGEGGVGEGESPPVQADLVTGVVSSVVAFIQRTFFNQTPTTGYNPAENSQSADGVITGDLNAVDADGDPLAFTVTEAPQNGTVQVNADGTFTYTPQPDFAQTGGADQFVVTVEDQGAHLHGASGLINLLSFGLLGDPGHATTATVALTVQPIDTVAADDAFSTAEDTPLTANVLSNDSDADGDTLTAQVVETPANGTLSLNPDGTFTYTPNADFTGTDTFNYVAFDGTDLSNTATVTIDVTPVNDAPVAVDDGFSTVEDTPLTITTADLVGNDSDVDGDALTAQVVNNPANGTLSLNPDGTFTYTPDTDFTGTDTFNYVALDGTATSNTATASIDVTAVNDAPVIGDPAFSIDTVDPDTGIVTGTVNVSDPDGDELTFAVGEAPDAATGVVTVDADTGAWTFTPTLDARLRATDINATPADQQVGFAITASDGPADATVTITAPITSLAITTISVGDGTGPFGVAVSPDATRVYVTNLFDRTVSVIDTATNTITTTIGVGNFPTGVAVSPNGATRAYVSNSLDDTVSVIDTATNTVTTTLSVDFDPGFVAFSPDGTRVYITQSGATVSVIDTATNTVTATIPVGDGPGGVAVTPDGATVYVTNTFVGSGGSTISVIDTATNTVTATFPVDPFPRGVAVSPDGARAYVAHQGGTVSVIDTATNTVTTTIGVGGAPDRVAVSPDGARVYVANRNDGTVSVIDTATNTVTATLAVGDDPRGVAVSPDGARVYVANNDDGTVSVIDL